MIDESIERTHDKIGLQSFLAVDSVCPVAVNLESEVMMITCSRVNLVQEGSHRAREYLDCQSQPFQHRDPNSNYIKEEGQELNFLIPYIFLHEFNERTFQEA